MYGLTFHLIINGFERVKISNVDFRCVSIAYKFKEEEYSVFQAQKPNFFYIQSTQLRGRFKPNELTRD